MEVPDLILLEIILRTSVATLSLTHQVAQWIKTREDRQFVLVKPRIHCRVKYKKWTQAGYLREPVFQGFCFG
jgi:hypothetical protein